MDMQEYVTERSEVLVDQVRKLRENSAETVKEAITGSADALKSLKAPVRTIARSGVKLTAVSQEARQNMIELVSDVIQAALTEAALRLERATKADNLIELVREQIELTPATREFLKRHAGAAQRAWVDAL